MNSADMHNCEKVISVLQWYALEQRHHSKGISGVHQVAPKRTTENAGIRAQTEETGAGEQAASAQDSGCYKNVATNHAA